MFLKQWNSCYICMVCVLRPLTVFLFKIFHIQTKCNHSSLETSREAFVIKKPKLHKWTLIFYFSILLCGLLESVYFLKPICMNNEADCMILISNTILTVGGIWITRDIFTKLHYWIIELNKCSNILDELVKEPGVFEHLKKFSTLYFRVCAVVTISINIQFIIVIFCVYIVVRKNILFLAAEITLMLITFTQIGLFKVLVIIMFIFKHILKIAGILFCQKMQRGRNFHECIEQYKKYLWMSNYTWRRFTKTMHPMIVVCIVCNVATIILNAFSLIMESSNQSSERLFILSFRLLSTSTIIIFILIAFDYGGMVSIRLLFLPKSQY